MTVDLLDLSASSICPLRRMCLFLGSVCFAGRTNIHESFALVKQLDMGRVKWVYAVSMLRHFQGYQGFLKSLNKNGDTVCRAITWKRIIS